MRHRAAGAFLAGASLILMPLFTGIARGYEHFRVAVYSRAYETREMNDVDWIEPRWTEITRQVHVNKIYLETHRDLILVNDATLDGRTRGSATHRADGKGYACMLRFNSTSNP